MGQSNMESNKENCDALGYFEKNWDQSLEDLKKLVTIPSVSFDGFPKEEVRKSAHAVCDLFKRVGLENIEILEMDQAHPYVYADWLKAGEGAPTLLLYAHHDVQPPGREHLWKTPPFEPIEKMGEGGLRLYGRGSADDKAGIIVHTSAIEAYLKTLGTLPVNVKVLIEGEEEIGSGHLEKFLLKYQKKMQADVLVLTDTLNYESGLPSLTTALRGLVTVDIEVRALTKTVHSGMWGGPLPDPVMALSKMLSRLMDDQGKISIPGFWDLIPPLNAQDEKDLASLPPFNEKDFRAQSGLIKSAVLFKQASHIYGQIWKLPSLSINAIQSSSRAQAGNTINDTAWARIGIRIPPKADGKKILDLLKGFLKESTPWGLELSFLDEMAANGWSTETHHPAFECAARAMKKGYGRDAIFMGCGGSIPFVEPFAKALGGAPALLVGVEDPYTNAHGENESLLLSDLKKACLSQIHLFSDIRKTLGK